MAFYRTFADWHQLNSALTFTNCVFLVAEGCVDHPQHSKRFCIVRSGRDELGRFIPRGDEGGLCRGLVASSPSDDALTPSPRKRYRAVVTSSDRQSSQRTSCAISIALAQGNFQPKRIDVF